VLGSLRFGVRGFRVPGWFGVLEFGVLEFGVLGFRFGVLGSDAKKARHRRSGASPTVRLKPDTTLS